jgi:hypothetical protein
MDKKGSLYYILSPYLVFTLPIKVRERVRVRVRVRGGLGFGFGFAPATLPQFPEEEASFQKESRGIGRGHPEFGRFSAQRDLPAFEGPREQGRVRVRVGVRVKGF